ncbi:2-amino-4-hydroxy-6-hydroxymethyldihydropteridine diphosphokinase [Thalassobius sp. I31.1]|uniref:2-amino-4-hydroxy-6- hydroxymethyldihydropteridine diphosphokinase n=1 Tax=Thalassobius sp. I31.1 TaxID=2109912 RepID=UPI001E39E1E5|nr:2-amino-4-hydroxy-6-hydroxymethyldihydropteridine diphosphokinase [Thalassobius sp. I31.1]
MKSKKAHKTAVIALGANDDSDSLAMAERLQAALTELESEDVSVRLVSKFYHSPCFPADYGNDFVNAVAVLDVLLPPNEVLMHLHEVEKNAGRIRRKRWGTRPLDLDLLAQENCVLPNPDTFLRWHNLPLSAQLEETPGEIILPHPRITDRGFVLIPMRDVAPDWVHPVTGKTVDELIAALPEGACDGITPLDLP